MIAKFFVCDDKKSEQVDLFFIYFVILFMFLLTTKASNTNAKKATRSKMTLFK